MQGTRLAADFRRMQSFIAPGAPTETRAAVQQVGAGIDKLKDGLERAVADAATGGRGLVRTAGDLDSGVRSLRMVPFAEAGQGLERTVRDLALEAGKEVVFKLVGHEVELDRAVAERLKDPLLHLVRNAVDHGIETPAERAAAGKPTAGSITLSAALKGAQVEITITDDGRGIDRQRIREEARARGLPESAEDRDLLALVFHPGLSTARALTAVSGRGVGLDVVKSQVIALHGTVGLESVAGVGTTFTLTVPLDHHAHPSSSREVRRADVRGRDHAGDGPPAAHPRRGPERGRPGDAGRNPRITSPRLVGGSPRAAGAPPRSRARRLRRAGRGGNRHGSPLWSTSSWPSRTSSSPDSAAACAAFPTSRAAPCWKTATSPSS